jgi:hypothetical protein
LAATGASRPETKQAGHDSVPAGAQKAMRALLLASPANRRGTRRAASRIALEPAFQHRDRELRAARRPDERVTCLALADRFHSLAPAPHAPGGGLPAVVAGVAKGAGERGAKRWRVLDAIPVRRTSVPRTGASTPHSNPRRARRETCGPSQ